MFKNISLIIFLFLICEQSFSQELNCQVTVLTPQIQETDKSIYDDLEIQLRDFINNRPWTNDEFLSQERIECSIIINISERVSTENFKATIQIQSRRPVYGSSYNTPMINHQDNDFTFRYVEDQVIDFDESNINSNLTAVIGFYVYMIIGMDYDSYSPEGGTPYFTKAQTIVNNAQRLPDRGWKAFESSRNRYWLVENVLNVSFRPFRNFTYIYHRQGFDKFKDNVADGRATITDNMKDLKDVYQDKPNSFLFNVFFTTKAEELISLYSQATSDEKTRALAILTLIDPANTLRYNKINQSK